MGVSKNLEVLGGMEINLRLTAWSLRMAAIPRLIVYRFKGFEWEENCQTVHQENLLLCQSQ